MYRTLDSTTIVIKTNQVYYERRHVLSSFLLNVNCVSHHLIALTTPTVNGTVRGRPTSQTDGNENDSTRFCQKGPNQENTRDRELERIQEPTRNTIATTE